MMRKRSLSRLPGKLMAYFEANPEEELTYADLVAKFGVSIRAARACVDRMTPTGELESVHVIRLSTKGRAS